MDDGENRQGEFAIGQTVEHARSHDDLHQSPIDHGQNRNDRYRRTGQTRGLFKHRRQRPALLGQDGGVHRVHGHK